MSPVDKGVKDEQSVQGSQGKRLDCGRISGARVSEQQTELPAKKKLNISFSQKIN